MDIYANGKNIPTYSFANLFTQGEQYADKLYFVVDRFYNDIDLYDCSFLITGLTENDWQADSTLEKEPLGDKIRLTWTVSPNFTANSGMLKLCIRAALTPEYGAAVILKYTMPPVFVRPALNGQNGPLPESGEQAVSQINAATSDGLDELQQKIDSFTADFVTPLSNRIAALEAAIAAMPGICAVTQAQYDVMQHDPNTLYVIIEEDE